MRYLCSLLFALCITASSGAQEIDPSAPVTTDTAVILRTYVAGLKHHVSRKEYDALQIGEMLILKAEPENKYDPHAIAVYKGSDKLGFIPAQEAEALSEVISAAALIGIVTKKGSEESQAAMSVSIAVRRE